jgi:hypothetical protein
MVLKAIARFKDNLLLLLLEDIDIHSTLQFS